MPQAYLPPAVIYKDELEWEKVEGEMVKSFSISQIIPPRSTDRFQVEIKGDDRIKPYIQKGSVWFIKILYTSSSGSSKSLFCRLDFMALGINL
jgi:hypothetical protein